MTLALAVVASLGYAFEEFKEQFPWLITLQLKSHALMSRLEPREARVERVALVLIDDVTFWGTQLHGVQPTNRKFLANIARAAADGNAAVIAIDFQMKSPDPDRTGDDEQRKADNAFLLETVRNITAKGIPVVMTCGLVPQNESWKRQPNIFDDTELPQGTRIGHINLPHDKRQIPLATEAWEWDGRSRRSFESFALQIVNAYEAVKRIKPPVKQNRAIRRVMEKGEFVYGDFLPPSSFPSISAIDLLGGRPDDIRSFCNHQVILIGGSWHRDAANSGPLIESFQTPAGFMPGCYVHANYVEALLDNRVKLPLPRWCAPAIDFLLGFLIVLCFFLAAGTRKRLGVLAVFFLLISVAYLFFINVGWYLDFIVPLSLLFFHLPVEDYLELKAKRRLTASSGVSRHRPKRQPE